MRAMGAAALALVWLVGCGVAANNDPPGGDLPPPPQTPARAAEITVMTQNLYVGADVEAIYTTPPAQIPQAVSAAFASVKATDFPARAQRIADEVEAAAPDVIALQEVSLIRTQLPGDYFSGNPVAAADVAYDYLAILQSALQSRGLRYQVAEVVQDTDVELPSFTSDNPPQEMDIRLTDRDVLLVRSGLFVSNAQAHNYDAKLTLTIGGAGGPALTVLRGWVSAEVAIGGRTFRVIDTHLEDASNPAVLPIQEAQAQQLLGSVAGETLPTILLGDFNSDADTGAPTYQALVGAGFVDAWAQAVRQDPGYTCCQASNLLNATSQLATRIDLVMVRQPGAVPNRIVGRVSPMLVGNQPSDKTPSGLWPSDHAGLAADLQLGFLGRPAD